MEVEVAPLSTVAVSPRVLTVPTELPAYASSADVGVAMVSARPTVATIPTEQMAAESRANSKEAPPPQVTKGPRTEAVDVHVREKTLSKGWSDSDVHLLEKTPSKGWSESDV